MEKVKRIKKQEDILREMVLIQKLKEDKMVSAGSGTIVNAISTSASFCMKNPRNVGINQTVEEFKHVDFFTKSLNNLKKVFSTDQRTFLHFSPQIKKKEDNKKRKKEIKF